MEDQNINSLLQGLPSFSFHIRSNMDQALDQFKLKNKEK